MRDRSGLKAGRKSLLTAVAFFSTVFCMTVAGVGADDAEVRTWTDSTGKFKREGSFQRLDGDAVVIKKAADGQQLSIPMQRLSTDDQAYARKAAAAEMANDPFRPTDELPRPPAPKPAENDDAAAGAVRVVVAQGVGTSVEAAKKDAYREAVRQVVGAYVEGETLTRNDELIEDRVLSLSGALVEKADVIPESVTTKDGLTRLRIRAEVKVTEVMKSLGKINVTTTAIRTADIAGQVVTLSDQTENAELALGDAKAWEAVPASFFSMKLIGQPKVLKARGDEATVELLLQLSPNRDEYMAFAKRLVAVLSKLGGPHGTFAIDGRNPNCERDEIEMCRQNLWLHTLVESDHRGNGADPEIAYAFPEPYREVLKEHFVSKLGLSHPYGNYVWPAQGDLPSKSQCLVYCFNQGTHSTDGCGLSTVGIEWKRAIGKKSKEVMVICLMTQANESFNRTKWDWFTCEQSLFSGGRDSPWLQFIECEATLLNSAGEEIASDIIPLIGGFGISGDFYNPIVMMAPAWMQMNEPDKRSGYVPQLTFPRRIEVTASEAATIKEVKCVVRPLTYP